MNRITVELAAGNLDHLAKHNVVYVQAQDAANGEWAVSLRRHRDGGVTIDLAPLIDWAVRVEGVPVGSARGIHPSHAAREALRTANIARLPEATLVQVRSPGRTWVVFRLRGRTHAVLLARFRAEVAESGRWVAARAQHGKAYRELRARLRAGRSRPEDPSGRMRRRTRARRALESRVR